LCPRVLPAFPPRRSSDLDVVLDEGEVAVRQMRDVGGVARQEVVDADDGVVAVEQRFGQMGADEAGGPGDDDALLDRDYAVVGIEDRKSTRLNSSHVKISY